MLIFLDRLPHLHPIFVHFSVALLSLSTLLFWGRNVIKNQDWKDKLLISARLNLWIGTTITTLTLATGFIEYYTVTHDGPSHHIMTLHRNWAIGTSLSFCLLTLWSIRSYLKKTTPTLGFLLVSLFATMTLAITAFKGGENVFEYGLGVKALPKIEIQNKTPRGEDIDKESYKNQYLKQPLDNSNDPKKTKALPHSHHNHSH